MSESTPATMSGPVDLAAPLLTPFGKYVLVRKIAEGGMAEIFLAKQVGVDGFEKNVVIKRMLASLTAVSEFVEMFRDEARLAAQLSHPNVVQILELGLEQGSYFIAMEYLAGEDLSVLVRRSARLKLPTSIPMISRIIADAARGLNYAHDLTDEHGTPLGLVHRDISPSNVFVSYTGQVKVLDFGIARAATQVSRTAVGTVKGKAQYMAPEQASAHPIDRRSDVYSLGVSLYEALSARRPFARDTDLSILKAVVTNDYVPLRDVRADVPVELAEIARKAMALLPADRYQTGDELAAALDAFLAGLGRPSASSDVGKYVKELCGDERVIERTRIPSLKELRVLAGKPSAPDAAPRLQGTAPSPLPAHVPGQDNRTAVVLITPAGGGSVPVDLGHDFGAPARSRLPWLFAGLATVALVVTFAWLAAGASKPPAPEVPLPTVEAASDAGAPGDVGRPAPAPLPAAVVTPEPVVAPPEPPQLVDAGPPAATPKRPAAARPVVLNGALFSAVMRKSAGPVARCFVTHRASLPAESGSVPVQITVAATGRVTAVSSPLGESAAGKCVEAQARAIVFPAHQAKEATFAIPFAWKAKE